MKNENPEGIFVFEHRRSENYLNFLKERLSIEGENGLINRAIPVPSEWKGRTKHKKMCQISFLGISANNLFDKGKNFLRDGLPILSHEMQEILRLQKKFEDAGIWLRIRFLFTYPFSTHAMSIINAEMTHDRCEINGDWRHPSEQTDFQVDWKKFHGSTFVRGQRLTLTHIENWLNKYDFYNERGNRSFIVRFTPVSPNVCTLIINDTIVCDSYLLAKENRHTERLIYKHPIVKIERGKKGTTGYYSFQYLMDHFQYLWQLNITLDCGDATKYVRGKKESLCDINLPEEVSFRLKAERLVEQKCLKKENLQSWILKTKNQFKRYVSIPEKASEEERIFISCSWVNNRPNNIAEQLHNWIESDFTNNSIPGLKPTLVRGRPGEMISQLVYEGLDNCELGIVLLTNDLKSTSIASGKESINSKPNIYHELGYLMCKFNATKEKRKKLLIASENSELGLASNIKNFIFVDLTEDEEVVKIHSFYTAVLKWLYDTSILLEQNINIFYEVIRIHKDRIVECVANDTSKSSKNLLKEINDFCKKIEDKLNNQKLL